MIDINKIADAADMIINGYAFLMEDKRVRVLNLNRPEKAAVLKANGEVLETSMDDIELSIVTDYYSSNKEFMKADD